MKARLESLSLLANNIANSGSPGFKGDSEVYSLYTAEVANTGEAPLIDHRWTDFSQGTPFTTGTETDVALRGQGFFRAAGPSGEPLLTRNGSFTISPQGRLETQEGYPVLNVDAKPIEGLDRRTALEITSEGDLRQNGALVARLGVVNPEDATVLSKRGASYFALPEPASPLRSAPAELLQGRLEAANVAAPSAAVRLIDVLRQFEVLQKAIQIGGEMSQRVDEIARVGS